MKEVKIRVEEAGGVFQLRVVADVFIQDGDRGPTHQLPTQQNTKNKMYVGSEIGVDNWGWEHSLVETDELWVRVHRVQRSVDEVH